MGSEHVDAVNAVHENAVHEASVAEMDPVTLYRILQLRVDVFVVEQNCPYPELDGRDLQAAARHLWIERDANVLATLRIIRDPEGMPRIGRVATAKFARSEGLAGRLVQYAIDHLPGQVICLEAQSYLQAWYERFGFVRTGDEYVEDGIPHVPMRRNP